MTPNLLTGPHTTAYFKIYGVNHCDEIIQQEQVQQTKEEQQ